MQNYVSFLSKQFLTRRICPEDVFVVTRKRSTNQIKTKSQTFLIPRVVLTKHILYLKTFVVRFLKIKKIK